MSPKHSLAFAAALILCAPALAQQQELPDSPVPNALAVTQTDPHTELSSSSSSTAESLPSTSVHYSTTPTAEVTVLEDTLLRVRTNTPISTGTAREGAAVSFLVSEDVIVDNVLIIPRGAAVHGTIVHVKKAGTLTGSADLTLKLVSLELSGRTYPLYTYQFKITGMSKTRPTERAVQGAAVVGALAGSVVTATSRGAVTATDKLVGASAGVAVGAGLATLASAASPGPAVTIPAESQIDFYLASPIAVLPPTAQDAAHLSHLVRTGEPVLYVHGETP